MKIKNIPFNIHDLNFILTFSGFAIFTSITDSISSVAYRAFALIVAIACLVVEKYRFRKLPTALKVMLFIVIVLDLKTTFHLFSENTPFIESRNLALLFIYGVTLIPVLAFVSGYRKIHWKSMLIILELMLFFTIMRGNMMALDVVEEGRMSLNARQSTLAFGDNSGYLLLLSICLLRYSTMVVNLTKRHIWKGFLMVAIAVAVLGIVRAGSRGPLVSAVMGSLFIFVALGVRRQMNTVVLTGLFVVVFGISMETLERFAPVLFHRMELTIEEQDTSGRNILFAHAIQTIEDNPISGSSPIILHSDGFNGYHNGYLDVGVCLGIIGFLAYIWLSIWVLMRLLYYRSRLTSPVLLFLSSMFFLSATRTMTGAGLLSNPNYTLIIACACIIASNVSCGHKKVIDVRPLGLPNL